MKFSEEQLAEAVRYWSRRYGQELSQEAAAELMQAIVDFMECLREQMHSNGKSKGRDDAA